MGEKLTKGRLSEDLKISPTYNRTKQDLAVALTLGDESGESTINMLCVSTVHSIKVLDRLVSDMENAPVTLGESTDSVVRAFEILKEIADKHPDSVHLAFRVAEEMMFSWGVAAAIMNADKVKREIATMRPLAKANNTKAATIKQAKAIAAERWQADTSQEIRLGDMADRVYREMMRGEFAEMLPGSAERVKEWIKPVAPEYARKGGRSKKTA